MNDPYCPKCGVVQQLHSGLYCSRLHEAEKARDEARLTWHAAENELWLAELRDRIATLTEQRDSAMELIDRLWADYTQDSGFGVPVGMELEIEKFKEEIAKEKGQE